MLFCGCREISNFPWKFTTVALIYGDVLRTVLNDLIGIQHRAPNNGTYGRLHEILTYPPVNGVKSKAKPVEKCSPFAQFPDMEKSVAFSSSNCFKSIPASSFAYFNSKIPYCYVNMCSVTALIAPSQEIGLFVFFNAAEHIVHDINPSLSVFIRSSTGCVRNTNRFRIKQTSESLGELWK
ncbi:unnamed protein product [Gongylonema pulchrum]|uniref:Uncharacterized protein n=1 Tax=Gongylonema pulchrum TaxID=637853 RepID=A0A183DIC7_9BILA|nr:unnamed protein product [Gongylonema pulchrum]